MGQYQLKITLKSDLCVSDGGVYNSLIDTDICYDTYGFPYIPGKRIKGCLRECALELNDWGKCIPIEKIFGDKGSRTGSIRIGNALLENYKEYKDQVAEILPNAIVCRQNVVGHFTYMRTQTRLNSETGAAQTGSLRTFRAVKKGLVFLADVLLDERYDREIKDCCAVLKHMGISRTRGLGEVLVEIKSFQIEETIKPFPFPERDILEYELYLEDPVVCKSVNGGEENTQDYIEGSKIMGILLERTNEMERHQLLEDSSLIFSNAYLQNSGKRCVEVPASYYSIKNNSVKYVDKTAKEPYEQKENEQLNQMKHCYICKNDKGELVTLPVSMEQRYHHRRPEDKGVGRAVEEESGDSKFYQISSISAGQSFRGYILGDTSILRTAAELLNRSSECYVGYGKRAEYGRCRIRLINAENTLDTVAKKEKSLIVKLEAPTIVYSEYAAYTTDSEVLLEEICAAVGIERKQIIKAEKYINYTTVGGFNSTWGKRKPHIEAFDKGTVICLTLCEETEIFDGKLYFIGERCKEGFGEMRVFAQEEGCVGQIYQKKRRKDRKAVSVKNFELGKAICNELFDKYLQRAAGENAKQDVEKNGWKKNADVMPTVANLLLMCSENQNMDGVAAAAEDRFGKDSGTKEEKLGISREIRKSCTRACGKLLEEFCTGYDITDYQSPDYELKYLKSYLSQLKYSLRKGRIREHEKSN